MVAMRSIKFIRFQLLFRLPVPTEKNGTVELVTYSILGAVIQRKLIVIADVIRGGNFHVSACKLS